VIDSLAIPEHAHDREPTDSRVPTYETFKPSAFTIAISDDRVLSCVCVCSNLTVSTMRADYFRGEPGEWLQQ
jgi:hypothetical protein